MKRSCNNSFNIWFCISNSWLCLVHNCASYGPVTLFSTYTIASGLYCRKIEWATKTVQKYMLYLKWILQRNPQCIASQCQIKSSYFSTITKIFSCDMSLLCGGHTSSRVYDRLINSTLLCKGHHKKDISRPAVLDKALREKGNRTVSLQTCHQPVWAKDEISAFYILKNNATLW